MTIPDKRKKELEEKITDLEDSLTKLKTQLNREQIEEQHQAIDHLDDYLDEVDHKYSNLKDFWSLLGAEIRELFSKHSDDDTKK